MRKLHKDQQQFMRESFLKYPTKSDSEIAKLTKISRPTITKYRKEYSLHIDTEFVAIIAGKFIHEFGQAIDHWKLQMERLEQLMIISDTPMEKLAIERHITKLRENILFLASQGEVREVIKVMRTGQLPPMITT